MNIRIAQVKVYPRKGDLAGNHHFLISVLDEIACQAGELDVAITPECFLDGYVSTEEHITRENIVQYAVNPADSQYVSQVAAWAASRGCWTILGCTRIGPGGARNSALVLNRAGELVGTYDKTHLQNHDHKYVPGERLPVFASDFGPFGVMICADRRWPETVRTLALQGARVIFNPTYGMHGEKNLRMMQTRSYESEVFIAFTHPGQSLVTDPRGEIVSNLVSDEQRYQIVELDLEQADLVRAGPSAHLRDRRPDLYQR